MSAHPNKPKASADENKNTLFEIFNKYKSQIRKALMSLAWVGAVGYVTSVPDTPYFGDTSLADVAWEVTRHPQSRIGYAQTANIFHTLSEKIGNISHSRIGNLFSRSSEADFMDEVKNIRYSLTTGHEDSHEVIQITTTHTNTGRQEVLKLTCQDGLPVTLNGPVASYQQILDVLQKLKNSGSFAELEQDTPWGQMLLLLSLMIAGGYYTLKTEEKKEEHEDDDHGKKWH